MNLVWKGRWKEKRMWRNIKSLLILPSCHSRKYFNWKYLPADLIVGIMYGLYQYKCHEDDEMPKKMSSYNQIFHTEFSISFHVQKMYVVYVFNFCIVHRLKTKSWRKDRVITLKVKKWRFYTVQKQTPGLCTIKENSLFCCLTVLNVGVNKVGWSCGKYMHSQSCIVCLTFVREVSKSKAIPVTGCGGL
jgi:hypothetical protein